MARFYSSSRGQGSNYRGKAGTRKTGLECTIGGWYTTIKVVCTMEKDGRDVIRVYKTKSWNDEWYSKTNSSDQLLLELVDEKPHFTERLKEQTPDTKLTGSL